MKTVALIMVLLIPAATALAQDQGSTTVTGTSREFNPAISLNSLLLASWRDPRSDLDGLEVQELELAMSAVVDPYFTADVFVAYEPDPEGPEAEVAIEEVFVTTTSLPAGLAVRGGRFFIPFGRHNQLHAHLFPLVEAPLAVRSILAEESAGDVAVEAQYSPDLSWYLNLRGFVGDGAVEGVFDGASRELALGGRAESLWDLTEATTFEAGASIWDGVYAESPSRRTLFGADVRLKYRDPRTNQGRIVDWVTELVWDHVADRNGKVGLYTVARYRFARVWWVGAGYSWSSFIPEGTSNRENEHEVRGQLAFAQSEYTALRADLSWLDPAESEREVAIQFQLNFNIGSHPTHSY
jgi:hypothetical protein